MICEICNQNRARRTVSGFQMCNDCFDLISKIRVGNIEAAQAMETRSNEASQAAKEYINQIIEEKVAPIIAKKKAEEEEAIRTTAELAAIARRNQEIIEQFSSGHSIPGVIAVRDDTCQWVVCDPVGNFGTIHSFSDLISYEIVTDGKTIQNGSAGTALAGALLFGTVGAIVGGAVGSDSTEIISDVHIRISVNDISNPSETITFLSYPARKDSEEYRGIVATLEKTVSILDYILNCKEGSASKHEKARAIYAFSVADEISKFKALMDQGIITPEEFVAQKEKLLRLEY